VSFCHVAVDKLNKLSVKHIKLIYPKQIIVQFIINIKSSLYIYPV